MAEIPRNLEELVNAPLLTVSQKPLDGKSALVTGATRMNGIGFAIAERFVLEGASPVVIVGTERSKDVALLAVTRLKRYGIEALSIVGDITRQEECIRMMKTAYEICEGNVDILVNNAGTNRDLAFGTITQEDWEYIMKPKTLGALLMTQEWFNIRNIASIKGGRVINIGSVIGEYGNLGQEIYAMANAALVALTKTLSITLGRRRVNVNLIAPGFVEGTDMTVNLGSEKMEMVKTVSAISELLEPKDIALAASFLAGPGGERVTGAILSVDCGIQSNYIGADRMYKAGFRRNRG